LSNRITKLKNRFFNRSQNNLPDEARHAMTVNTAAAEAQKNSDEVSFMQNLGMFYEYLHDDPVEQALDSLMHDVYVYNDPTTKAVQIIRNGKINFNFTALRMLMSHKTDLSFLSKTAGELAQLDMEYSILNIESETSPDEYGLGLSNLLIASQFCLNRSLNNALDGRLARLLRNPVRTTDIRVGQPPKEVRSQY